MAACEAIPVEGLVKEVVDGLLREEPVGLISARFHLRLAGLLAVRAGRVAREASVQRVALGGGCFQNRILLTEMCRILGQQDLEILLPSEIPLNDGGLALGQLAVIAARLEER
jgi:hydrogenase maturation protein HypF